MPNISSSKEQDSLSSALPSVSSMSHIASAVSNADRVELAGSNERGEDGARRGPPPRTNSLSDVSTSGSPRASRRDTTPSVRSTTDSSSNCVSGSAIDTSECVSTLPSYSFPHSFSSVVKSHQITHLTARSRSGSSSGGEKLQIGPGRVSSFISSSEESSQALSNRNSMYATGKRDPLALPPSRPRVYDIDPSRLPFLRRHKRSKSTALFEGETLHKPWVGKKKAIVERVANIISIAMIMLGFGCGALLCYNGIQNVPKVGNLCLVLEDHFDDLDLNGTWSRIVDMGGFGNGEFEMTTDSPNNSFVENGILYIVPTLTSDIIGNASVFDGYTYNITGCTNTNLTACGAVSNITTKTLINPIQSARLTTKGKYSIKYGKVEVRARIPKGDWIWPGIWMLPEDDKYGAWPLSGEIDIMESRGNDLTYTHQGRGFLHAALNWGPISFINAGYKTFGWWTVRRQDYSNDFHTFVLEWTDKFIIMYVDSPLQRMYNVKFKMPFFERGEFPYTVWNGSQEIPLTNPWIGRDNSAPFDQNFYIILDVAVGGTNGWFPDGQGKKPWLDGSLTAMYDFATKQDQWYPTWPTDIKQRALAVDYVKMWQKC